MSDASELLTLLDGLRDRSLMGRAVVVKSGEALVQLNQELGSGAPQKPQTPEDEKKAFEETMYGAA